MVYITANYCRNPSERPMKVYLANERPTWTAHRSSGLKLNPRQAEILLEVISARTDFQNVKTEMVD